MSKSGFEIALYFSQPIAVNQLEILFIRIIGKQAYFGNSKFLFDNPAKC